VDAKKKELKYLVVERELLKSLKISHINYLKKKINEHLHKNYFLFKK